MFFYYDVCLQSYTKTLEKKRCRETVGALTICQVSQSGKWNELRAGSGQSDPAQEEWSLWSSIALSVWQCYSCGLAYTDGQSLTNGKPQDTSIAIIATRVFCIPYRGLSMAIAYTDNPRIWCRGAGSDDGFSLGNPAPRPQSHPRIKISQ